MPKKVFSIWLDEDSRIAVKFTREKKHVGSFVAKLEVLRRGRWREVQRYDTHHDCVHKDLLTLDGEKERMVRYDYLDGSSGFTASIRDFKENHRSYVWRWEHGDKGPQTDSR